MRQRPVWQHGIIAGVLGATSVAIWFLLVDILRGRPFLVPAALGNALFGAFRLAGPQGEVAHIVVYTVFHFAAFIVAGLLGASIADRSRHEAVILAAAFLLFIVFEGGFYGLITVIFASTLIGVASWYQIAVGNVIAAVVMGTYLWKAYPHVGSQLNAALDGRE